MKEKRELNYQRFDVDSKKGLTKAQVAQRKEEGLTNFVKRQKGKSYLSIFIDNIFTFFR